MRHFAKESTAYINAAWCIRDGILLSSSIDEFLDIHRSDEKIQLMGKAAIVRCILEAERGCKLYIDSDGDRQSLNTSKIADTWYVKFMQMFSAGLSQANIYEVSKSASFIVFNYDRCFEFFLFKALQQLYAISAQDAEGILNSLSVLHPYGKVGALQTRLNQASTLPFGGYGESIDDYLSLASAIKTYTEQIEEDGILSQIKEEVAKADCIVFLGCAFHAVNMRLLDPGKQLSQRPVFGTAFNMSSSNASAIFDAVDKMFVHVPRIGSDKNPFITIDSNATCRKLLDDYQRAIIGQ